MKARAAILREYQQPLSIEEVEIDPPKADEVLVKIAAAGVCHSDYHIMKGEWQNGLPMILGHEASGIVAEVGPGVTHLKPGDRCALSFRAWCGRCRYCIAGRPILCNGYDNAGPRGSMLDGTYRVHKDGEDLPVMGRMGGFAEYAVMPAQQLVPITADIGMDVLCLIGCAVTTGLGSVFNTAKVTPGSTVAVIGCGGVGLNAVQGAYIAGASRVIAIDMMPWKLDLAREFGATDTINATDGNAVEQVLELTGGGVEYAFEAIGLKVAAEQSFAMLRKGGTATIIGMIPEGQKIELPGSEFLDEKKIQGSNMGSNRFRIDMPRYVDLYMSGRLKLDELVSARISLDQINEGFEAMRRGETARSVVIF